MKDPKITDIRKNLPQIKPHLGTFASGTEADVKHHLFIAGEFLNQLARIGDEYSKIRADAAHGVLAATVRYAVLVARGMGMTRGELLTIMQTNWSD